MATRLIRHLLSTPQWLPLPGFAGVQVRNAAGGQVLPIDDWTRLDRFLILGSEGGTYYASEAALTVDNAAAAGLEHVVQALARYRREVFPARVVTAALTATGTAVVPADDPLSLGIAGLDASLPQLVAWFMAQRP